MIISEVNSLLDLVCKATNFMTQLQNGWYKRSAEVDAFQDKVWMLSEKHVQWSEQLRRHGISEDKHLLRAVQVAVQLLEEQKQYVKRLQKNPLLRLRKKAFPGQLSYSLSKVLEIVDAGPQLLADRVATHDLLERSLEQTPAFLPFSPDPNYVPISESTVEVRKELENKEGLRVVTVYGGPGLGKSSLVKHLALLYEEESKQEPNLTTSTTPTFPDGVHYLCCGQGAQGRVKQLQLELLKSLGFGASSAAESAAMANDPAPGLQEGNYLERSSLQMKLRSRLVGQKLLIVLDDLWEGEVLREFLVPAKGVKYLLTSQSREVWNAAHKIHLKRPTETEARAIMANYTEGLPTKGKFPHSIRSLTDAIIESLDGHPLALANIGISINESRATDLSQWEAIRDNFHVILDDKDFYSSPIVYDRPYNLAVGASMMLMVESLLPEARRLLFLMALLEGPELPETLIKFFYKFVLSVPTTEFILKYNTHEKYLEDRSLVELKRRGNEPMLAAHSLRTHYIREKKTLDVSYIASHILAGASNTEGIADQIKRGDADETLVAILSAVYYEEPFRGVVGAILERHLRIIDDGVIPRSLNGEIDVFDLVEKTRHRRPREIGHLVQLLNPEGECGWRREAHESAKKIIIKYFCQDILDDSSMASLLKLPHATTTACSVLSEISGFQHSRYNPSNPDETFSSLHGDTMRALLELLHNKGITTSTLKCVIYALRQVLPFESKDVILSLAPKWVELLEMDSDPELQCSAAKLFSCNFSLTRASIILGADSNILVQLYYMLCGADGKITFEAQMSAAEAIQGLSRCKRLAMIIASIPNSLCVLFYLFLDKNFRGYRIDDIAREILCNLSCVPENWTKFQAVRGDLEDLGRFLADTENWEGSVLSSIGEPVTVYSNKQVEIAWPSPRELCESIEEGKSVVMWDYNVRRAAVLVSNLAQADDLREIFAQVPDLMIALTRLVLADMAQRFFNVIPRMFGPHALTMVYSQEAVSFLITLSPENLAELLSPFCYRVSPPPRSEAVYGIYKSLIEAHVKSGMYSQALSNLDMAQHHLDQIFSQVSPTDLHSFHICRWEAIYLRDWRTFSQAMLEDYEGALMTANSAPDKCYLTWGETGVIRRLSGDFEGALSDFNKALQLLGPWNLPDQFELLAHRGYVKYLMKDIAGARIDAEAAQQLNDDNLVWENTDHSLRTESPYRFLRSLPVSYLGLSFQSSRT